jgi:class 3 adenylate cyclase/tetratricopeptide (TPR) repeat protein
MADILSWLVEKGLAKYVDTFRENDIDFDVLPSLGDVELKELGVSLGDRKRLQVAIAEMAKETPAPTVEPPISLQPKHLAERRQLTVVFVDLADSTALSRRLDPEDLRDAMRTYHHAVAAAIRENEGFVAKFMGDGVLAYFGYPHASEDAAERAVRASLRAVVAVKALPAAKGHPLLARAGVATGPVVVGDVMGEDIAREVNVVGETPNLAARLLALGPPGSVIIAGSTRRLIGALFTLEELGPQTVKGIAEPVLAFQVTGERQGLSRYEATRHAHRSTFVGRSQELGLLLDRWEQATVGDGQLVLLSGEAGIGKSRMAETLWQTIGEGPHHRVRYQCSPQHINSPLFPVVAELSGRATFQPDADERARREHLIKLLPNLTNEQAALVGELVGIPLPANSSLSDMAPAQQRSLLLAGLAGHLRSLCSERSLFWLIEDAHWIDPTTEELISRVVDDIATQRLMILLTHRPDYKAPWVSSPAVTSLSLARLSRRHTNALLEGLAMGKEIPIEILDYIAARADGVPLFMEELFQALRDSGAIVEAGKAYALVRSLDGTEIPTTLQDSLMARLDRLAPAKAVAQLGAAIGREFSYELLQNIAGLPQEALTEGLGQLTAAGLLFSRGTSPNLTYVFKHALIQDAAHASMLRDRRHHVHNRIAQALSTREDERPELVAQHFEAAGEPIEAANWLDKSGDLSVKRAANNEGIRSWRKALQLMSEFPATPETARCIAEIKRKLAVALTQVEGYRSESALTLGEEALHQAQQLGDMALYAGICTSIAPSLFARQDFGRVEHQLAQIPDETLAKDPLLRTRFLCIRGIVCSHLARFPEAHRDLSAIVQDASNVLTNDVYIGGGDIRVVARSYLTRCLVTLGLLDQALSVTHESLELARSISHSFSIAWALQSCGWVSIYMGKSDEGVRFLDESMEVSLRYGYPARRAHSQALKGVALIAAGEIEKGIIEFNTGRNLWAKTSGVFSSDYLLMEAAHFLACHKRFDYAAPLVEDAGHYYSAYPERMGYSQYHRLKGLLAQSNGDAPAARHLFEKAITVAERQGAKLYELRARYCLAKLLDDKGEKDAAHAVLDAACRQFVEGQGAPDLLEANALLAKLRDQSVLPT